MNKLVPAVFVTIGVATVVGSVTIQKFGRDLFKERFEAPVAVVAMAPAPKAMATPDDSPKVTISQRQLEELIEDKELRREIALREWDHRHKSDIDAFDKIVDAIVKLVGAISSLFGMYMLGKKNGQPT